MFCYDVRRLFSPRSSTTKLRYNRGIHMPNQITLPSKRSYLSDVRSALRAYIHAKHPETHPDALSWDIAKWESCRSEAIADDVHEDRIPKILACVQRRRMCRLALTGSLRSSYHAQLVFALTKLPSDVRIMQFRLAHFNL
jgi:programmed cell death 6-interacting protein